MIPGMADRSRLATERMSVSVVRVTRAAKPQRVKFLALEGPMVVMIQADSEDDAHAICAEQGLEFVSLCDDA
jgi:hypothetical protein